jgi:hemolysin III
MRGVSHQWAFVVILTLAPIVLVITPGIAPRFVMATYMIGVVGLFGVSALYHRHNWGEKGKAVMRRLDHSMIFVAIAATYTPIAIFVLPGTTGLAVLIAVWFGTAAGIASRVLFSHAPYWVIAVPYVAVGWACVAVAGSLWHHMGVAGMVLLIVGGVLYTIGAGIYATRRPNPWPKVFGYHEIFHLFVIAGAALHCIAIVFFALPKA